MSTRCNDAELRVSLRDDPSILEELEYRLNFLEGVSWEILGDEVVVRWTTGLASLETKVQEVVSGLGTAKRMARDVIFESAAKEPLFRGHAFTCLLEAKEVTSEGRGILVLGETVSALMDYFDSRFIDFADAMGAERREYPALMAADILDRCSYFGSFPQYVGFVSHVIEDPHLYNEFGDAWALKDKGGFSQDRYFKAGQCVLSPAVCYHCYNAMEGEQVAAGTERVVTARGKCFRYEAGNMIGLERLWEFSMREVVFIGTASGIRERRRLSLDFAKRLVDELKLIGRIEVATDPFFVANASAKRTYQAGFHLKYELRLELPAEAKSLAVASFNVHEDFFGRTFQIQTSAGEAASTGCSAFGLERWAYAFLAQYGFDQEKWPADIVRFMARRGHREYGF